MGRLDTPYINFFQTHQGMLGDSYEFLFLDKQN